MKVLIPRDTTDATLVSCSIPEDDYAEWDSGTTYSRGDFVISIASHTVYRSLTDSNLNNDPDVEAAALSDPLIDDPDPVNWQIIGATNRWQLFDKKPSTLATATDNITAVIAPGVMLGGISGFNISARSVTITIDSVAGGGTIYEETIPLQDNSAVTDWWAYYFEPIVYLPDFFVSDFPSYGDAEVTVSIDGVGTVSCGQIVLGGIREIGTTMNDGQSDFQFFDFSKVEQDEFGNLTTVRRAATRIARYSVEIDNRNLRGVERIINDLRGGVPAVWVGVDDRRLATITYGYCRDFRAIYKGGCTAFMAIEIQGIV